LLRGRGPEPDEQVGLAGAGIPDEAERLARGDPGPAGEGVDVGGVDVGVCVEVEVLEPLLWREPRGLDPAGGAPPVAFVALTEQQLGQEPAIGQLFVLARLRNRRGPACSAVAYDTKRDTK